MFGTKESKETGRTQNDVLDTADEIDLKEDSAVEQVTTTWVIENALRKESETASGTGTYEEITATSDEFPYPITLRYFTEYTPTSSVDKNGNEHKRDKKGRLIWVAQQRGNLKLLAQAVFGSPTWTRDNAISKQFTATTRDDGSGRATLGRFKKIA